MTTKEKVTILKRNMGKKVYSYFRPWNEIINSLSIIEVSKDTIKEIANRKQCYLYDSGIKLWSE